VQGPLLIKGNDDYSSLFVAGAGAHWQAETSFVIPNGTSGASNFCEWCHGLTPRKNDASESNNTATVAQKYAHPVDSYPTDTRDNRTNMWISNLPAERYDANTFNLKLRYPVNADSSGIPWKGYEESGNLGGYAQDSVTARGTSEYLVCVSCHDVHFGQVGTPILRGPSSPQYCEDCHFNNPLDSGASHPIKNLKAGTYADLTTEDGGVLPNYAYLPMVGTREEVVCRTCHGGPFNDASNEGGMIHGGFGRFMLADYVDFAEICVNCHGYDSRYTPYVNAATSLYTSDRVAALRYASATAKAANPSYWYTEGPSPSFAHRVEASLDSAGCASRVGSHFVGAMYANRPKTSDPEFGWLGSLDTSLDHFGSTGATNGTPADNWLDTAFGSTGTAIRKYWSTSKDGTGVPQYSVFGYISADVAKPVFTCLGCHTPHGAAAGSANNGPADDTTEDTTWDGELLLAKNVDSYICYTCHLPNGTHPCNMPNNAWSTNYVTRTDTTINLNDTAAPFKILRDSASIYKPANYPYGRVMCESCHSAHSANSRWGDMILEGDTTRAYGEALQGFTPEAFGTKQGLHNKRPTKASSSDSTKQVKDVNDRPTCEMCHPQGTADQ